MTHTPATVPEGPARAKRAALPVDGRQSPRSGAREHGSATASAPRSGERAVMKVEAIVVRDRVETVMEAVEEQTGHVGVTVVEAVGHGREKGITHEYRGRVFESRFLPKAHLTFVVRDEIAESVDRGDRRCGEDGPCQRRRDLLDVACHQRDPQPNGSEARGGGGRMSTKELAFAASTVWVLIAAVLVMFMQAGFAFLEAGLTRMKNVGHIAAKNVLVLAIASIVYYLVGFGIAFGDGGNGLFGGSGFLPTVDELLTIGAGAVLVVLSDSRCGRLHVRGRLRRGLAGDRLGRDGRAHPALGVLRLRGDLHAHLLRRLALGLEPRRLALLEGHAGLRRVDGRPLPGRSRGPRRSPAPRAANRQVRRREAPADPGAQHGVHHARRGDPLVRVVRLQPGVDALASTSAASASSRTSRSTRTSRPPPACSGPS